MATNPPGYAVSPLTGTGIKTPTSPLQGTKQLNGDFKRNLSNFIAPVQLERLKYDVKMWRESVMEAEFAYYPHRVKMQRMFRDTNLNGHVKSCVLKRKRMTTLRKFSLCVGEEINEEWTAYFKKAWFANLQSYVIDAIFYGYSLISLGTILDNQLKNVKLIQRWNISPDRYQVGSYVYANQGKCFYDADVADWHIYVPTASEDGQSPCGYGLYYNIAIYEIIARNTLGFNTDFVERFSMPYVHGKTTKTDESERGEFEMTLRSMGANGYAVTDPMDEIEFLEAALAGTGWNGYDNLESRMFKVISKLLLGHADALDSTPGKLGGSQDGTESPAQIALAEVQAEDGTLIEQTVNEELIPKLKRLGFNIPDGLVFKFTNDDETEEQRRREDESNKTTAEVAKILGEAGFDVDPAYITERTKIPVEKKPEPEPLDNKDEENGLPSKVKNKLKDLYA